MSPLCVQKASGVSDRPHHAAASRRSKMVRSRGEWTVRVCVSFSSVPQPPLLVSKTISSQGFQLQHKHCYLQIAMADFL